MTRLLIHSCTLIDCNGNAPLQGAALLVDENRIAAVGTNQSVGADALARDPSVTAIDAQGLYMTPGLIDAHVHLSQVFVEASGAHLAARLQPDAWFSYRCYRNAWDALSAGITTLRVVGEHNHIDLELKKAINNGVVPGPRLVVAGRPIIITGGHGHNLVSSLEADGPYEVRKRAREQLKAGADLIKIMITGGIASPGEAVDTPQMTEDEMEAACVVAHNFEKPVTAHAGSSKSIQTAIRAGVDGMEHGYVIDEETAAMMADHGTFLVPTLGVTHHPEYIEDPKRPEWWRLKAQRAKARHFQSLQYCLKAGVTIGVGSDIPDIHEYCLQEMELLSRSGMTGMQVLEAATRVNSEILRIQDQVGTLEPGKLADFILLAADPRETRNLRKLKLVVKDGKIMKSTLPGWLVPTYV